MELHERTPYAPIVGRPPVTWAGGAPIACWVVPNVEHYELTPPPSPKRTPWPRTPAPDIQQYSYRDYGNRIGLWRMADLFEDLSIIPTLSLNLAVLDHYPEITSIIVERSWDVMSHGIYNTRYIYEMNAEEERAFYADGVDTLERHTGMRLRGMLGPAISGTPRTPELMVEAGLHYHADWIHDDQPAPIVNAAGTLVSVPYNFELNDAPLFARHVSPRQFADENIAQFDRLHREASLDGNGRVFCLALHPFLVGQPHAIGHLRRILEHVASKDVWWTTGGQMAQHYIDTSYSDHVAFARAIQESDHAR